MFHYRSTEDLKYFASDLNKYASIVCSKNQSIMNIDMIQYKRDKKHMRLIEYKHSKEKITKAQVEIYEKLAAQLNKNSEIRFEVVCIKGDYPFEKAKIYDFNSCENWTYDKEDFIKYLNFHG